MSSTISAPFPTTSVFDENRGSYGYTPTRWICALFVALFGASLFLHVVQAIRWRTWWMLPTMAIGCIGEVAGWSGRLWSSFSPTLLDPFLMQITSTIIAPSFMSAANFTILGFIIRKMGTHYSWLSPRWYLIVFITLDLASLVVQSVGGASASGAARRHEDADSGGRIMLYGIVTQMIAITIYVALAIEFVTRYHFDRPVRKPTPPPSSESEETLKQTRPAMDFNTKLMLAGLVINTLFLYVRAVYRTIELNDGWSGRIISDEHLFNWLDGMPITICTYVFNILHPGRLLGLRNPAPVDAEKEKESA